MNGENEKGKRAGEEGRKVRDKFMRICACEQVSAKKEEGRGRREEKSQRKSMREQASVNSSTFLKRFLPSIQGFSQRNMNRSASPQNKHTGSVVSNGNLFFTFSAILKNHLSHKATKTTARPTNNETGHTRTYSTTNETLG